MIRHLQDRNAWFPDTVPVIFEAFSLEAFKKMQLDFCWILWLTHYLQADSATTDALQYQQCTYIRHQSNCSRWFQHTNMSLTFRVEILDTGKTVSKSADRS